MSEYSNSLRAISGKLTSSKADSDLIYGRVQPQAIPLEEAVLGAIMIDKDGNWRMIDFGMGLTITLEGEVKDSEIPYKERTVEDAKKAEFTELRKTIEEVYASILTL